MSSLWLRRALAWLTSALIACSAPLTTTPAQAKIVGDGPWQGKGWSLYTGTSSTLTDVIRWNRCGRAIEFQIYLGTAPENLRGKLERLARREVADIAARTGLPFAYEGLTTTAPKSEASTPGTNLVIAFVAGGQAGGVVRGGSVSASYITPWHNLYLSDDTLTTLEDARVFVDWEDTKGYSYKRGKVGLTVPNVLRRGLATAVGLQRIDDPKQVMHGILWRKTPGSWGAGDLHALKLAGESEWCDDPTHAPEVP